ncbi:hypothetical protein F4778DRAFT_194269 [Xylariomycetidae sp. FL2044]|nr:hypothetical protein F4778DRAFT_194269 [Xylariomycetidae sp. FL2044]
MKGRKREEESWGWGFLFWGGLLYRSICACTIFGIGKQTSSIHRFGTFGGTQAFSFFGGEGGGTRDEGERHDRMKCINGGLFFSPTALQYHQRKAIRLIRILFSI